MKGIGSVVVALLAVLLVSGLCYGAGDASPGVSGDAALQTLKDGNGRFVAGKMTHPDQSLTRVTETAKGQKPIAVVVSCSDSRVPPEVVFDQGIGDVFVVRTAGEVVKDVELGSIEYAVEHLHVPLVVVLGHKRCGAVEATAAGGHEPGHIASLVEQIKPAVAEARKMKGDVVDNAVRVNTRVVADKIGGTKIMKHMVKDKKVKIVRAYYDIDDGTVTVLEGK